MTVDELHRFRRGELPADEVNFVSRHLVTCVGCALLSRQQIEAAAVAASLRALLRTETPSEHPDVETVLSQYVDETLSGDQRLLVDAHLEECAICSEDVADLKEVRRGVQPRDWTVRWLIAAGIAGVALTGALLWTMQDRDVRVRPHPQLVTIAPTAPPAQPAGYGRADWDRLVREARHRGFIAMPAALRVLQAEPDDFRGAPARGHRATFTPVSAIVESTRPELRWPASEGARYIVAIFRNDQEVSRSPLLTRPSWIPSKPLARGATYEWQVDVRLGEGVTKIPAPPDPPATFAVLDADAAAAIDDARRRFPDDHQLAGLLYARAGVRESALRELESWIAAHPHDRRAAEILISIRRW